MRDDDQDIARPGDGRGLQDARRVRVRITGRAQAEEFVNRIGRDVSRGTEADKRDLARRAESGRRVVHRHR